MLSLGGTLNTTTKIPMPIQNENGITVKELREWLNSMPDIPGPDEEDGEVWVGDGCGYSNVVTEISSLNRGDIILSPSPACEEWDLVDVSKMFGGDIQ